MKVLIVGGGGREHALAWKTAQSPAVERVYVAPGNAGTAVEPRCENVAIAATDIAGLLEFAQKRKIDLTIVGPEAPLVAGMVDEFRAAGLACFGPTRAAARLEGSKAFTKAFCERHAIPGAAYRGFRETEAAREYARKAALPLVIKADGLAAGKGVVIAETQEEADRAIEAMLSGNAFGAAGREIVIEEFLRGEEASYIVLAAGEQYAALASSQDHKRIGDGDTGPNTGGMGAVSPAPIIDDALAARIENDIIRPALAGLASEDMPYTGFLYAGLMIGADGAPRLLEFNCRLGDPETQPILMRLESSLPELIQAALAGDLVGRKISWDSRSAVGVVLAAAGYPGSIRRGDPIRGLDGVFPQDVKVFHAGTAMQNGDVVTAGGRVLCATALGKDFEAAQAKAYETVEKIRFEGMQYRRDIGFRAVSDEK
ncbi:MAG TPA: phosphoribosylamine--glycine ligase [Gammaproteobacteria bacterium]|nr:phosphoribosylamine--glycine ligase [Gammaproteobacteria bacterium]